MLLSGMLLLGSACAQEANGGKKTDAKAQAQTGADGAKKPQAPARKGPPPPPVRISVAMEHELAPVTWYPGTVISRNQARLAAEVAGRLVRVADVGATIRQGDEVARIDDTMIHQELLEAEAAVAREEARLTYLDSQVERLQQLVKQRSANRREFDEAVANRGVTRSELAAYQARAELTRERQLRTIIRAPFSGVVTERLSQRGEWADSGDAVVRLVDSESLEVQTWVPVAALAFLQPGSTLEVESEPNSASAVIRTLVPVGDDRSKLYELRLGLEGVNWPAGQTLRVAIPTAQAKQVVAVPRDALVLRRDGTAIYRITADGTAERVSVKTGVAAGELIEVTNIFAGDRVVIRGGERLRPGQQVQILNDDAAKEGGGDKPKPHETGGPAIESSPKTAKSAKQDS